jgi:hypothetical protein
VNVVSWNRREIEVWNLVRPQVFAARPPLGFLTADGLGPEEANPPKNLDEIVGIKAQHPFLGFSVDLSLARCHLQSMELQFFACEVVWPAAKGLEHGKQAGILKSVLGGDVFRAFPRIGQLGLSYDIVVVWYIYAQSFSCCLDVKAELDNFAWSVKSPVDDVIERLAEARMSSLWGPTR